MESPTVAQARFSEEILRNYTGRYVYSTPDTQTGLVELAEPIQCSNGWAMRQTNRAGTTIIVVVSIKNDAARCQIALACTSPALLCRRHSHADAT